MTQSCPLQEFLTLLRLGGVSVSPAAGLPSGPRPNWAPLEKRNVVGRGLRRPVQHQQQQQRPAASLGSCTVGIGGGGAAASARQAVPGTCGCGEGSDGESVMADADAAASPAEGDDSRMGDTSRVESMVSAMESLLREVGEDPAREGLQSSARRYVSCMLASTAGCQQQLPAAGRGQCNAECSATACGEHGQAAGSVPRAPVQRVQEYHIRFGSQVSTIHPIIPSKDVPQISRRRMQGTGFCNQSYAELHTVQLDLLRGSYNLTMPLCTPSVFFAELVLPRVLHILLICPFQMIQQ